MRTVIKVSDIIFYGSYQKIRSATVDLFQFSEYDIVWGDDSKITQSKIQNYLGLQDNRCKQQEKINILFEHNINLIPSNILIPFLYKKFKYLDQLRSYLGSTSIWQNISVLNKAEQICKRFPQVLGNKIAYDFFKSSTGRASANVGVITKQQRRSIPCKNQLVQFDFSGFQPTLYQDYFLGKGNTQDVYRKCQGQTRQQKKLNWFRNVFSDKQYIRYTNVYGRYKQRPLVDHLQALQTDSMSRLIIQVDSLIKKHRPDSKILMFLFDGFLWDIKYEQSQQIMEMIEWQSVFPKSNITRYPFKLSKIRG